MTQLFFFHRATCPFTWEREGGWLKADGSQVESNEDRITLLRHFGLDSIESRFDLGYLNKCNKEFLLAQRRHLETIERSKLTPSRLGQKLQIVRKD